jgi:hypothetical protein
LKEIAIKKPVLFLVFNRPDKTQIVFDVIKTVKPKKLYVAADGPRPNVETDAVNCLKVREIVSKIEWECDVQFLFHNENLGCSLSGKTAWDWVFNQEEEMIFIEDDGLISKSFFWFAQELLDKYCNNNRIAFISGENFGSKYGNATYFFSRYSGGTYSMATWRRVYELYEFDIQSYPAIKKDKNFVRSFTSYFSYKYLTQMFENYLVNGGNTYDLQLVYLVHKHNMLNIIPNINLCSNIGFDVEGTNTAVDPSSSLAKKYGNRQRFELNEIVHPELIQVDKKFEKRYFKNRVLLGNSWISSEMVFFIKLFCPLFCKKILRKPSKFLYRSFR